MHFFHYSKLARESWAYKREGNRSHFWWAYFFLCYSLRKVLMPICTHQISGIQCIFKTRQWRSSFSVLKICCGILLVWRSSVKTVDTTTMYAKVLFDFRTSKTLHLINFQLFYFNESTFMQHKINSRAYSTSKLCGEKVTFINQINNFLPNFE